MDNLVFYIYIKGQSRLRFTSVLAIYKFIKTAKIDIPYNSIIQVRKPKRVIGIIKVGKYLEYLKAEP